MGSLRCCCMSRPLMGLGKLCSIQEDAAPEMAKDKTMKAWLDAESQQRRWMQNKEDWMEEVGWWRGAVRIWPGVHRW